MRGADMARFEEVLDEIEEVLAAQEGLEQPVRAQMVTEGVRKVAPES
jgi:hypothetical protein